MKRVLMILAVVAVLAPASLWAQDTPKAEIFGGYSLLSLGGGGDRENISGWQAAVSGNLSERFGDRGRLRRALSRWCQHP